MDGKSKRKQAAKGKKGCKKVKEFGEGLDEETKSILDNQLDQLVIEKPAALINQAGGKDSKSLKEAFLRRPANNIIMLLYGPIAGRPPTVFFNYPPFLKMQRSYRKDRVAKYTQDELKPYSTLCFKINNSTHTYNCVVNAFKTAGFRLSDGGGWNCLWTGLIRPSKLKYLN